jgi:hypothetical protein
MYEIFSYWIFIWFILYYIGLIKYNPLFILIVGYILTLGELIYMIFMKISYYNFMKYFIINIIIKFIPILLLLIKFNFQVNIKQIDIYISILLILIYFLIMIMINKNPYIYYKMMINTYINTYINNNNKYKSIFSKTYDYIYMKIIKK